VSKPAVLCVLTLAAAAQAADFSHRAHLALKLECAACHTAVAASTSASDNLLPRPEICLECHREGMPVPAPAPSAVAHFSHALHLKLGNIAPLLRSAVTHGTYLSAPGDMAQHLNSSNPCLACHRDIDTSEKLSSANMPRMADCLVCHNEIDPPYSCSTCHLKTMNLAPPNHIAATFIDTHPHLSAAEKQTCAVCHDRTFTCAGCHSK